MGCIVPRGSLLDPGSNLLYQCNPGYRAEGNTNVYCEKLGNLSPIPECVEVRCASLNSPSITASCMQSGQWVNCGSLVPPGTRAEVSCRPGYKKETGLTRGDVVYCEPSGEWIPEPIRCEPVCGRVNTHQPALIVNGSNAALGDFPWHASLYIEKSQTGRKKFFICGATIIQNNVVMTAAHCVWDEITRMNRDPSEFFVATGNIFRDYDLPLYNDSIVQKAMVKSIHTHDKYHGLRGNFDLDIALLELQTPFEFSGVLMPACLDDSEHRDQFLEPGVSGRVAGFGRTATGKSSYILQTLTLDYISYKQCKASNSDAENEVYISSDKFCAGYTNGSAVCEGDSGGGLVFRKGDLWHVMGIVSVGLGVDVTNGERSCDTYNYSLYTKVAVYMKWIRDLLSSVVTHHSDHASYETRQVNIVKPTSCMAENVTFGCLVPPQPEIGEFKLHQDSCQGEMRECPFSEGTVLRPGSHLHYSCAPEFEVTGPTDVYCSLNGNWSRFPICTGRRCPTPDGYKGYCTLLKYCESALEELRYGNEPFTCGFAGLEPIVCCPSQLPRPFTYDPSYAGPGSSGYGGYGGYGGHQGHGGHGGRGGHGGHGGHGLNVGYTGQEVNGGHAGQDVNVGYAGYSATIASPDQPASVSNFAAIPGRPAIPASETSFASEIEDSVADGRGAIARKKCKEYTMPVGGPICPWYEAGDQQPVNESTITGKVRARPMEFPHMVAVGFNLKNGQIGWHCGGTLISETFVLTAAQCTNSRSYGDAAWARVGDLNLKRSDDEATPLDRRITERIVYPEYKPPLAYHDIALLRLESRVPFNDWIRPACLYTAPSTDIPDAIATGWGAVDIGENNVGSDDLMKVTLPLVREKPCNARYNISLGGTGRKLPKGIIGKWTICAGANGKDTCQGDTGGPLVIWSRTDYCMYDLIGITSLGKECGGGVPSVYTRVYNYIGWIESVVWPRG